MYLTICKKNFIAVLPPAEGIYGGHNTTINRHPWQVSLQHNGVHFCGAAILNTDWALTSGQCATKYVDLTIRAGSNHTREGGEVYEVQKIVIHPNFDEETLDSDLALIKFTESITVDHAISTVLPQANASIKMSLGVDLTGWGYTTNTTDRFSEMIQFAQIPPAPLSQCRESYPGKTITENMWCGYDKITITSCIGDFGGPAISEGRVYGIQSWGQDCGDAKHPSIFVMVSHFIPWIEETIKT